VYSILLSIKIGGGNMPILEMEVEWNSDNVLTDAQALQAFKDQCALLGAKLVPWRDSIANQICGARNDKRGWKIEGRVEITKLV
jgi:hypothetical protein